MKVLNYGCGYDVMEDAVNVDLYPVSFGTLHAFMDEDKWRCSDEYDIIYLSHVIEHVDNPLDLMEILWDVAKPDGLIVMRCPHGNSDDAWENPTHVRPMYPLSFLTYSQEYWWREYTRYQGDWKIESITMAIDPNVWDDVAVPYLPDEPEFYEALDYEIRHSNNVVTEMVARLRAVKPRRNLPKGIKPDFDTIPISVHKTVFGGGGWTPAAEEGSAGGTGETEVGC